MEKILLYSCYALIGSYFAYRQIKKRKSKLLKDKSVASLLYLRCHDYAEDEGNPDGKISSDSSESLCNIGGRYFFASNTGSPSLTLIEAITFSPEEKVFIKEILDKSWWQEGVEYKITESSKAWFDITVYVDIDYKNDPISQLNGYIDYLISLQNELNRKFHEFRNRQ